MKKKLVLEKVFKVVIFVVVKMVNVKIMVWGFILVVMFKFLVGVIKLKFVVDGKLYKYRGVR